MHCSLTVTNSRNDQHSSPPSALSDAETFEHRKNTNGSDCSTQQLSPFQEIFERPRYDMHHTGFTPVNTGSKNALFLDEPEVIHDEEQEVCQNQCTPCFSVAELVAIGAIADEELSPSTLSRRLFPAVDKHCWEKKVPETFTRSLYKLGNGMSGEWTAHNPVVWVTLEPCLRLVSKFLENAHIFPWFDALFYGRREDIVSSRIQPGSNPYNCRLQSFHRRSDHEIYRHSNREEELRSKILQFSAFIQLGIADGHANPVSGELFPSDSTNDFNGITIALVTDGHLRIYIAYQIIEPLLKWHLAPSVRLLQQFNVANAILKEFCHCMGHAIRREAGLTADNTIEPYFEDDRMAELGDSFALTTFGVNFAGILRQHPNSPYSSDSKLGLFLDPVHARTARPSHGPILDSKPWPNNTTYLPLPIGWIWEIQQEKFWNSFVRTYGVAALKPWPFLEGRRRVLQDGGQAIYEPVEGPHDRPFWLSDTLRLTAEDVTHLNARDYETYLFAKDRIRRRDALLQANPEQRIAVQRATRARKVHQRLTPRPWIVKEVKITRQETAILKHLLAVDDHLNALQAFSKLNASTEESYITSQMQLGETNTLLSQTLLSFAQSALSISHRVSALHLLAQLSNCSLPSSSYSQIPSTPPPSPNQLQRRADSILTTAHILYLSHHHADCASLCRLILTRPNHIPPAILAGAHMPLIELSTISEEKLHHAEEAVRLSRRAESETLSPPKSKARQRLGARRLACERMLKKLVAGDEDAEEVHGRLEECYWGIAREARRLWAKGDVRECARLCGLVLKGDFYTSSGTKSEVHFVMSRVVGNIGEAVRHAHHALALRGEGSMEKDNLKERIADYRRWEERKAKLVTRELVESAGVARSTGKIVLRLQKEEPFSGLMMADVRLRKTEGLGDLVKAEEEVLRGVREMCAGREESGKRIAMNAMALFQSLDDSEEVRQRKKEAERLVNILCGVGSKKREREDVEVEGDGKVQQGKKRKGNSS